MLKITERLADIIQAADAEWFKANYPVDADEVNQHTQELRPNYEYIARAILARGTLKFNGE